MDVSTLFRASVKAVSLKNETLGTETVQLKPSVKKQYSSFRKKSQNLVTQISKLREFLLENRADYLNFSGHLLAKNRLTDKQKDEIDRGAQEIISTCSQLIKDLKRDIAGTEGSQQSQEHREIMLHLIEEYLKNVCKIYSEQKAIRVKKTIELRNLSKLELNIKPQKSLEHLGEKSRPSSDGEWSLERRETPTPMNSSPLKVQEMNGDVSPLVYEEELSAEDVQMFQSENELLYNELNTITEEVKQIESKVVHIAELQGIFTEKVLTQDRDLDKLMTTVVGSTENVKEANEQIRQAIQRNAGLRVWILFFLLVMSFSLLFLDWYNP